ncbi:MAG: hypothetical protein ABJB76_11290 [Candidatus Nitrosocosmicus sp.]
MIIIKQYIFDTSIIDVKKRDIHSTTANARTDDNLTASKTNAYYNDQ